MARGWESKAIEAQQEDAGRQRPTRMLRSAEALERADRRLSLELARARAAGDLARASAPAHRRMLEQAIAALDAQLSSVEQNT